MNRMIAVFVVALVAGVLAAWAQSAQPAQPAPPAPPVADPRVFGPPSPADEYEVGQNDLLEIKVFELPQLDRTVRVTSDGTISLPLLGEVAVGGLTTQQAEEAIAQLLQDKKLVRDPQVSVFVSQAVSRRVFVQGAVFKPGDIVLLGARTLLDVIGEAGGLNDRAGRRIFVLRPFGGPGEDRVEIDAEQLIYEGDPAANIQVVPGDVIVVPYEQEYHIFVNGAVAKPGPVPFKSWEQMTLLQAVTAAVGATDRANESKVQVIRRHENGAKEIFKVNLKRIKKGKAEDMLLERNDIVVVPESFF